MRVSLLYAPDVLLPTVPYASLAVLTSCLEDAGHQVSVRDLNLEMFHELMQSERLQRYRSEISARQAELEAQESLSEEEARELSDLLKLMAIPGSVFEGVEDAIAVMNDRERFLVAEEFNRAHDMLRAALRFVHAVCPPPTNKYTHSIETVNGFFEGPRTDPVIEVFEEWMVDSLLAEEPDVIAFTLPFDPAIFHALKLCKILKQRAPHIPIILGGSGVDSHAFLLNKDVALFELYDYVMVGEGDTAFNEFLAALETGDDLSSVPNLHFVGADGEVVNNPKQLVYDLNALPPPDFSKIPLDRYLLPDRVATFQTSRGCYYGRCTFCSEQFRKNYRMRREQVIIEDIEKVHRESGIRYFQFWDALAPPRTLHYVSKEIAARGLDICWMAETKFEKQYSWDGYMRTLAEGGGKFLQFGFESGVERVLDLMDKGNDLVMVDFILDRMQEHGVQAGVTWFIGFPTETEADADMSYDFIAGRGEKFVYSSYTGTFGIGDDMIAFEQADSLGIEIFERQPGNFDFRYKDGTDHYDRTERNVTFTSRTDINLVQNNFELLFANEAPEEHHKLTARHRLGPLIRHVDPERFSEVRFARCPEATMSRFPRHPFRAGEDVAYAYQILTGHVYEFGAGSLALWDALDEPGTLADLTGRVGLGQEEVLGLLDQGVNRGVLKILCDADALRYLDSRESTPAAQSLVS